jgi:hypothetical protein
MCGPSLTETSLCGAHLYIRRWCSSESNKMLITVHILLLIGSKIFDLEFVRLWLTQLSTMALYFKLYVKFLFSIKPTKFAFSYTVWTKIRYPVNTIPWAHHIQIWFMYNRRRIIEWRMLHEIDEYIKKWLLHMQRMPQNRIPLKSYYRPQGRRSIGRPKKRWREQL